MRRLRAYLTDAATRADARWWAGAVPTAGKASVEAAIAVQIGLPTGRTDPFPDDSLIRLGRAEAARILAVAIHTDLAYGTPLPPADEVAAAALALSDMAEDAVFLGNGLWTAEDTYGWTPLTDATFDCGVIGYDARHAFIFWVEGED